MSDVLFPRVVKKMTKPLYVMPSFSDNDWETIIKACQKNKVPETWKVGDQKLVTIGGVEYPVDIIGKNHDVYADSSGKAPLTFQLHDCYAIKNAMMIMDSSVGGWTNSMMRNTHLPTIFALLPHEMQEGIREVVKLTSEGNASKKITATTDRLFLLSEVEVSGATARTIPGEGDQYEFYYAGGSKAKTVNGTKSTWWLRSPQKDNYMFFCAVYSDGGVSGSMPSNSYGVAPAFCF